MKIHFRPKNEPAGGLYRSSNGVIFGVCEGIAEYFDLNGWGVRLVFVLLTVVGAPLMLIAYLALAMMMGRHRVDDTTRQVSDQQTSSRAMLMRVSDRFDRLDKRLQRMESAVTRPSFELDRSFKGL